MKETGIAEVLYKVTGLSELERGSVLMTGINQGLEVAGKLADAATKAFNFTAKALKSIIDEGAEYERFQTRFTTLLGSMEAASRRMAELQKMGVSSGFTEQAINQAAILLETHSQYSQRALKVVMDTAAATGTSLEEVAQTIGMAAEGNLRGLRQYGVGQLDIVRAMGHEVRTETQKDIDDITSATIRLLEERMAGGVERYANTWDGLVGRLQRTWDDFKETISQSGVLETAEQIILGFLDVGEKFAGKEGQAAAQAIGDVISDAMWAAAKALLQVAKSVAALVDIASGQVKINPEAFGKGGWYYGATTITSAIGRLSETGPYEGLLTTGPTEAMVDAVIANIMGRQAAMAAGTAPAPLGPFGALNLLAPQAPPAAGGRYATGFPSGWNYLPQTFAEWWQQPGASVYGEGGGFGAAGQVDWQMSADEYKKAQEQQEDVDKKSLEVRTALWGAFYSGLTRASKDWGRLEKLQIKDIGNAFREGVKQMFQDYAAVKGRQAGIDAMEDFADAVSAFPNMAVVASKTLAGAKHLAVAAAWGVGAGIVGAMGPSAGGGGGATEPTTEAPAGGATNGTRSISNTVGVKTQSLNVTINIIHNDAAVYGIDGLRQLINREILPAVNEAIEIGAVG